ncbi:hypothetical protein V502_04160 [Pseudogymnoascus sp. VKM F-4520 (FW-2644)]|nr:hypothetical protein V502_04160 [Pseudogymnoascus sp. VKM F-4520 (FW-2644)]
MKLRRRTGTIAEQNSIPSSSSSLSSHPVPPPASAAARDWRESPNPFSRTHIKTAADALRCIDVILALYRTGSTVARQRATQRMRSCGVSPAAANMGMHAQEDAGLAAHSSAGHAGATWSMAPGCGLAAAASDGGSEWAEPRGVMP